MHVCVCSADAQRTGRSPVVNIASIALRSERSIPAWWKPTPNTSRSVWAGSGIAYTMGRGGRREIGHLSVWRLSMSRRISGVCRIEVVQ